MLTTEEILELVEKPIHILTDDPKKVHSSSDVVVHYSNIDYPPGSFCKLNDDLNIVSPELSFLQMSRELSLPELVEYGYVLCGRYAFGRDGIVAREPLTSKAAIRRYLESWPGKRPRAAYRALAWVAENSASPRETAVAMMLSLPYRYGGYGFPLPTMNCAILLKGATARMAGKSFYRCDLYWPTQRVDLEYDSTQFHTGEEKISADSRRRNVLAYLGVDVMTITRDQVSDAKAFADVAQQLARRLNHRIRPGKGFEDKHRELREVILQAYNSRY